MESHVGALVVEDPRLRATLGLLRSIGTKPTRFGDGELSDAERVALSTLSFRGFVWQRVRLMVTCPGRPGSLTASIQYLGIGPDNGRRLSDHLINRFPATWRRWSGLGGLRRVEVRSLWTEVWLTADGECARDDLRGGNLFPLEYIYRPVAADEREQDGVIAVGDVEFHEADSAPSTDEASPAAVAAAQAVASVGDTVVHNSISVEPASIDLSPVVEAIDRLRRTAGPRVEVAPDLSGAEDHPPASKSGSVDDVIAFLRSHHAVAGAPPLLGKEIAGNQDVEASRATVTRAMKAVFGDTGQKGYVAALNAGTVVAKLAAYQGEGTAFGTSDPRKLDR